MKMHRPWIIVLAGLALALSYVMPARAITHQHANDKANIYQRYECGRRAHCINASYLKSFCTGPYKGKAQWDCLGSVILSINGNHEECNVLSRWGEWGNLEFGARYCVAPIQDN